MDDPSICEDYLEMFFRDHSKRNQTIRLINASRANVRCFCVATKSWLPIIIGAAITLGRGFYTNKSQGFTETWRLNLAFKAIHLDTEPLCKFQSALLSGRSFYFIVSETFSTDSNGFNLYWASWIERRLILGMKIQGISYMNLKAVQWLITVM